MATPTTVSNKTDTYSNTLSMRGTVKASEQKAVDYWKTATALKEKAKKQDGYITGEQLTEMNIDQVFQVMVDIYSGPATVFGKYGVVLDDLLRNCKLRIQIRRPNTWLQIDGAAKEKGFAILAEKQAQS